jgi:integrase
VRDSGADERRRESGDDRWEVRPDPVAVRLPAACRDRNHNRDPRRIEGVTSHYFRKTLATLMDEAGLSARSAADQLGRAKPSLTADIYMGRKKRATGAAEVLEGLFQP